MTYATDLFMSSMILIYSYKGIIKDFMLITKYEERTHHTKTWNTTEVITLYFILFLNMVVFAQLFISYPLYLKTHYNIDALAFAKLFTLNSMIIVLIEVPLLNFFKNKNQRNLLIIGIILMCNGLAILPLSNHLLLAYISVIIWTLGEIIFFPSILHVIISATNQKKSRAIGTYQFIYCIGMLVGPYLCTAIYDIKNGVMLWSACSVISLLSCLLLALTRHKSDICAPR